MNKQTNQSTRETFVQLHNVSVSFEDTIVLNQLSFTLHEGDSVLLLGPSGCGKSTLAFVIAGLIPGSIEGDVQGEVWLEDRLRKPGGVGVVFQDPEAQFCMLHADDEVAFGLENLAMDPSHMPERIQASLERFGLQIDPHAVTTSLSGGMKQKLALACAFAMEPSVYILDEPTANLDPYSSSMVVDQIRDLCEHGQTVIVIEHKFDELLDVMKRVVLFDRAGRVHRVGDTEDVIREEWDWMVEQGIVPFWQTPPWQVRNPSHYSFHTSETSSPNVQRSETKQPILEVARANIRYGSRRIWQQPINLSIQSGEFVAILGKNGAGKSSLLQACMGLGSLSDGEIRFQNQPLRKWKRKDLVEKVAYVFQNPEHQFVFERVIDELSNRRVQEDEPVDDNVCLQLERFGLLQHQQNSPFALSQGQKRRLSVASMLMHEHDLYVLDEPTFGQDARTQEVIMEHLLTLNNMGKTIIMTTHDLDLVRRYATNVLVIDDTGLLFQGTPVQLFAQEDVLQQAHLFRKIDRLEKGDESKCHSYIV